MKLKPLASNMTQLTIGNADVLFSYQTPVAARIIEADGAHYYKTSHKWSVTTSRHINKFLPTPQNEFGVEERDQSFFDNLISEVK